MISEAQASGISETQGTGKPQAPGVGADEVFRGLQGYSEDPSKWSGEMLKVANDPTFAQQMLDRHKQFSARLATGENPLETGDYDLWRWQRAMTKGQGPGLGSAIVEGFKGTARDSFAAGEEGLRLLFSGAKATLTESAGIEEAQQAGRETADLATVAGAKAFATNNALVRGAGSLFGTALTKLANVFRSEKSREFFNELNDRHAFDAARANYQDFKLADNFHKDLASAVPALAGIIGTTQVNQEAASGLSNIPQMVIEGGVARGVSVASHAAAVGEFRAATEKLALTREALGEARTVRDALAGSADAALPGGRVRRAIADASGAVEKLEDEVVMRQRALLDFSQKAQQEVAQLSDVAASRVAAGRALGAAGRAAEVVGGFAEKLRTLPENIAEKIAPNAPELVKDQIERSLQAAAAGGVGYAVGDKEGAAVGALLGGSGIARANPGILRTAGKDLRRVGELFSLGEATLPFWRNVAKARDVSGFTRGLAAFMDNSVLNAGAQLASKSAKGAVAGAAAGAGFGALTNPDDPLSGAASGAGGGAFFGASVGFLGQWKSYENSGQIMRERVAQTNVYKDILKARPNELAVFEKLPEATQHQIANYLSAHPDLKVNYIDDPSRPPGSYDGEALPDEITVNFSSHDPLEEIIGHEIAHYTENHELGAAVEKLALGDPEAGIPGDYTARDEQGNPVKTADGKGFETNAEFNSLRSAYIARTYATAQARGWSMEKWASAYDRISDPRYIAREIWAEQHLNYLNSTEYLGDLKGGHFSVPDWVMNSAFLKNALGKLGAVFDRDGEIVRSNILGNYQKSASFAGLMREYYQRRAAAKRGDIEFLGGETRIDENALSKDTGYVERYFDASGEILRDTAGNPIYDENGKAKLRERKAADADVKVVTEALIEHLDREAAGGATEQETKPATEPAKTEKPTEAKTETPAPSGEKETGKPEAEKKPEPKVKTPGPLDPNQVQRREGVDGKVYYAGRYLSDAAVDAIEKTGKLNSVQLDNLKQINNELKAGYGREWKHFYQAATKKGGGSRYRSLAGRWRTDLVYGFKISKQENILLPSVSLEVLHQNAAKAVKKESAKLWNNELGDLLADTRTYLNNLSNNLPGETGIGVEKKNFINNLLGIRVKAHGDVNPLHEITGAPKTILTSLRLDRMNRVTPLTERNVPFNSEAYTRAAKNLRPDSLIPDNTNPGSQGSGETGNPEDMKQLRPESRDYGFEDDHVFVDASVISKKSLFTGSEDYGITDKVKKSIKGDVLYIAEINSNPQGHGYGTEAMKKLLARAKADGVKHAALITDAANPTVSRFYEKFGFERVGVDEDGADFMIAQLRPDNMTDSQVDSDKVPEQSNERGNGHGVVRPDGRPADAAEGAPEATAAVPSSAPVQLEGERLPHTVPDESINLVHYSGTPGIGRTDPAKLGKGKATRNDLRGENFTSFFVQGSPIGGDQDHVNGAGKSVYGARVSGARIYDANTDALGYYEKINRQEADLMLKDAGYVGLRVKRGDGADVVKLYQPAEVMPLKSDTTRPNAADDVQFRPDAGQVAARGVSTAPLFEGNEPKPDLGEKPSVIDAGRWLAARSRRLKRIPYDSRTPEAKNAIASTLADEIGHALGQHRNALGWYEAKVNEAMDTLAELHPEIKEDPDRGGFYKAITAITSNGQNVFDNFSRAEELYRNWKDTGRLDTQAAWGGARQHQINEGLRALQEMVDQKGLSETVRFLNTKFSVRDLKAMGFVISGEAQDHVVHGSAIFGPKVGGGFYPNLQGDFSPVTMDLWLMRTWNRVNGSYGQPDPVSMGRALSDLRTAAAENPGLPEASEIEKLSDRQLGNWAEKRYTQWARAGFKNGTPFDRPAKRFTEAREGAQESPRSSGERAWVREVFSELDKKLAERGLPAITNADKQALLWYYEKDLYALLGAGKKQGEPADYALAARRVVEDARKAAGASGDAR